MKWTAIRARSLRRMRQKDVSMLMVQCLRNAQYLTNQNTPVPFGFPDPATQRSGEFSCTAGRAENATALILRAENPAQPGPSGRLGWARAARMYQELSDLCDSKRGFLSQMDFKIYSQSGQSILFGQMRYERDAPTAAVTVPSEGGNNVTSS